MWFRLLMMFTRMIPTQYKSFVFQSGRRLFCFSRIVHERANTSGGMEQRGWKEKKKRKEREKEKESDIQLSGVYLMAWWSLTGSV